MTDATFRFLEIIGTWLSGVGSLLAVVVALYLARSQGAVRLKINAGHRLIITPGRRGHEEVVAISAANLGGRAVVVTNVLWITGIFKRQHAVQVVGHRMDSLHLHQILDPGHQGSFYIDINPDDGDHWIRRMAREMPQHFRGLWLWRMKIGIATAVGTTVWSRVEDTLQKKLLEAAEEADRSQQVPQRSPD